MPRRPCDSVSDHDSTRRVRIHKALADAGVASRRKAEEFVAAGRVTVNGVRATVGQTVDPTQDVLAVDGQQVSADRSGQLYLVLNKPAGVTSTVSDPHARETVIDLIPESLRGTAARIYPVGRLDRDSEGLLFLTNDGSWAQRMLHPSHGVEREYAVGIDHEMEHDQAAILSRGVEFEEGSATLSNLALATSADLRRLEGLIGSDARHLVWYRVTLRQGMKRQVRRMFAAVHVPVRRLVRVRFGTIRLTDMALGDVRPLTRSERKQLDALVSDNSVTNEGPGIVVSVDGPGGSGKSSVGAGAARKVGYRFCDTGVLYRGLTWLALERDINPDDAEGLEALVTQVELAPDAQQRYVHLLVDGKEISDELHTPEVDRLVSRVSQHASVRARLLPIQHALAAGGRIVMAGRDIGTVVLPDADLKVYLDVSIEERARRRAAERGVGDDPKAVAQIEEELRRRDGIDSNRRTAPLRKPDDAVVIDTDGFTLEQSIDAVVVAIRETEAALGR
jgi:cytidylate kinase